MSEPGKSELQLHAPANSPTCHLSPQLPWDGQLLSLGSPTESWTRPKGPGGGVGCWKAEAQGTLAAACTAAEAAMLRPRFPKLSTVS